MVIHQDNSMLLSKALQCLEMQQLEIQTFLKFEEFALTFFVTLIEEFDLTCLSQ